MENFTPVSGLIGGILIGLGAAVYLLLIGRIAGISGIVGGLLSPRRTDVGMRIAFILGLFGGPFIIRFLGLSVPQIVITEAWPLLVAGGLLVGFGTRLGAGCTSGHGVCGLARVSPRSMVATALFMGAGIITVFVIRHVIGG